MSLSIYNTHTHSLGRMSERGEALLVRERETEAVEIIFMFLGFIFGADSIFEEVVGFSPFMVSSRINTVFIVSCVCLVCLLFSQFRILMYCYLNDKNLTV